MIGDEPVVDDEEASTKPREFGRRRAIGKRRLSESGVDARQRARCGAMPGASARGELRAMSAVLIVDDSPADRACSGRS